MILTHPALTKLTFMDYLLTFQRILLRRKLDHDSHPAQPDRTEADRWLSAPPTASSTVTGARDARRRRRCDVDCLARSETA